MKDNDHETPDNDLRRASSQQVGASHRRADVVNLGSRRAERVLERVDANLSSSPAAAPSPHTDVIRSIIREELEPVRRDLSQLAAATHDDVLTLEEASEFLGVCSKTVLSWHREHGLPAHRTSSEWRFLRTELVGWVRSQG